MDLAERADAHAALGDHRRLLIVDHLARGDRTVAELAAVTALSGNLLSHHLDVLESTGLIQRHRSEGDHRRRYVSLDWYRLPSMPQTSLPFVHGVVFVCTRNSARSQFAAALWESRTGEGAESAGTEPGPRVHPKAVEVAAEYGIDLSKAQPRGYDQLSGEPPLVVSVCDRAREGSLPPATEHLHWSVPDPVVVGTLSAFRLAFAAISRRIDLLAAR